MARRPLQRSFNFPKRGGRRDGAGRPRSARTVALLGQRRAVSHLRRPVLNGRWPLHVTLRMRDGVCNLRTRRVFKTLVPALYFGGGPGARFALRIVHFSVLSNHLHFIVETADTGALSHGMQSLTIRMARARMDLTSP